MGYAVHRLARALIRREAAGAEAESSRSERDYAGVTDWRTRLGHRETDKEKWPIDRICNCFFWVICYF
jgi:hypothetical protein